MRLCPPDAKRIILLKKIQFSLICILLGLNIGSAYAQIMLGDKFILMLGDNMDESYLTERNQLGFMRYCRGKGVVDPVVINEKENVIKKLYPNPSNKEIGDSVEERGVKGIHTYSADPSDEYNKPYSDIASFLNLSEKEWCKIIAEDVMSRSKEVFNK